jgi:hypothetical protein
MSYRYHSPKPDRQGQRPSCDLLGRAKARLTIPQLWRHFNLPGELENSCCVRSPFHPGRNPRFSIYDGGRRFKDHYNGEAGDVFSFFCRVSGLSAKQAFSPFINLAGPGHELQKGGSRYV